MFQRQVVDPICPLLENSKSIKSHEIFTAGRCKGYLVNHNIARWQHYREGCGRQFKQNCTVSSLLFCISVWI